MIGKHKYIYAKVQRPEGVGVGFSMDLGVRLRPEVQIISFSLGEGSIGGARGGHWGGMGGDNGVLVSNEANGVGFHNL